MRLCDRLPLLPYPFYPAYIAALSVFVDVFKSAVLANTVLFRTEKQYFKTPSHGVS